MGPALLAVATGSHDAISKLLSIDFVPNLFEVFRVDVDRNGVDTNLSLCALAKRVDELHHVAHTVTSVEEEGNPLHSLKGTER